MKYQFSNSTLLKVIYKKLAFSLFLLFFGLNIYAQKKPNIIFIGIDDLRPELGCYGSKVAITPNLDKLAAQGLRFENAYCQQAICGPSRASLLTGMRPSKSGIVHNYLKIRDLHPNIVTLPQQFGNNGYKTVYYGKIFHHGDLDDEKSWNREPKTQNLAGKKRSSIKGYVLPENQRLAKENLENMISKYGDQAKYGLGSGPAYEFADVPDNAYEDGFNTDLTIETMNEMVKENDKPFFLAMGFNKPHLNWTAPKKYWDMYDNTDIPIIKEDSGPINGAAMGLHASFELRTRYGIPKIGPIDTTMAKDLMHAYLGCVSYVDAQIGRIVQAVEEAGINDNTIIIVWSDHGWHLGDMGVWGKATNYEIATRVPLIISSPNMPKATIGKSTDALVELIDMYPTLCDLAGMEKPAHLDGTSFTQLIKNPKKKWKQEAFSQFPTPALREWGAIALRDGMRETFFEPLIEEVEQKIKTQQKEKWDKALFENDVMGYAMRTKRYRFVVWKNEKDASVPPLFIELFDHKKDPNESINIYGKNSKVDKKLLAQFNESMTRTKH